MFVENPEVDPPMVIQFVSDPGAGQNVESEILTLRSAHVGVTVDPAEAESAGKVRNESPIWPNEIVAAAKVHAVIKVFDAANNRFGHERETKLVVTARPTPKTFRAVIHAPAN